MKAILTLMCVLALMVGCSEEAVPKPDKAPVEEAPVVVPVPDETAPKAEEPKKAEAPVEEPAKVEAPKEEKASE